MSVSKQLISSLGSFSLDIEAMMLPRGVSLSLEIDCCAKGGKIQADPESSKFVEFYDKALRTWHIGIF